MPCCTLLYPLTPLQRLAPETNAYALALTRAASSQPAISAPQVITQWVEAKRNKDFATADRLRKELRDAGIDPDGTRANVDTGFNRNPTKGAGGDAW